MNKEMFMPEISKSPQGGLVQIAHPSKSKGAPFEAHQAQEFDLRNNLLFALHCQRETEPQLTPARPG